jgi:hypothetical protein
VNNPHWLEGCADLEEQITRHPEWKLPAMPERVGALRGHVARLQSEGSRKFRDAKNGRFVGWIDSDGKAHDYGYTFLNLEAVRHGFANQEQAKAIVDWVSGRREVAGDTSTGADIYHWRFTDANAQPVGVATDHLVKTANDPIALTLGIGQQAKFSKQ